MSKNDIIFLRYFNHCRYITSMYLCGRSHYFSEHQLSTIIITCLISYRFPHAIKLYLTCRDMDLHELLN